MAQLRLSYQEIQKRDTEILWVTDSTPEEARLYFQHYQLLFPYLCDPERAVYQLYGVPMAPQIGLLKRIQTVATTMTTEMSDRLLRGEKSPSPLPYFKRYGFTDMEQAVFIIDRSGIIRYVHTTGTIGTIPSNADLLSQLATLQ